MTHPDLPRFLWRGRSMIRLSLFKRHIAVMAGLFQIFGPRPESGIDTD
jgi:hypothetical protein